MAEGRVGVRGWGTSAGGPRRPKRPHFTESPVNASAPGSGNSRHKGPGVGMSPVRLEARGQWSRTQNDPGEAGAGRVAWGAGRD